MPPKANPPKAPRPLSPRQLTEPLACSIATVYRLLESGQLPSFRLGPGDRSAIRVTVADLDAFIANGGAR